VESQEAISVNELHRAKAFRDHWVSFPNIGWGHASISRLRACRYQAELFFGAPDGTQRQTVPIVWTYCRIGTRGGYRPWFRCTCGGRAGKLYNAAGPVFARRAGKLYNADPVFACRKCCNLIYECQLKSAKGRLRRTASKIRLRLSWVERRLAFKDKIPPRPWGMRTAKYRKLISKMITVDTKIALWEQKRAMQRPR
jgi:hypothetical protein